MKKLITILILLLTILFSNAIAEDYVITINGNSKEIVIDKETTLVFPNGTSLRLTLHQKEYQRFEADFFSFEHKSIYKSNRTEFGSGIFQTIIMTLLGTGIIVQEYKTINPTSIIDMMLKEVKKEEIDYGYKYS